MATFVEHCPYCRMVRRNEREFGSELRRWHRCTNPDCFRREEHESGPGGTPVEEKAPEDSAEEE